MQQQIEAAKARAGRTDSVLLVAVTKNHPLEALEEAVACGVTAVGENRVQEAKQKFEGYAGNSVEWHLIGHLQVNKVRQAVPMFDLIHSVDSVRLLKEVERIAERENKVQRILLQVNTAREESKFGMSAEDLPAMIALAQNCPHVKVEGLMCMAPYSENPEAARPVFRKAAILFADMKQHFAPGQIQFLSMGMTNDFVAAIAEGANIVRVGTAIFGARQYTL